MLEKRGLPPTLSLLAESLLDGRLPPRSIAWLKIQTIAVNIRQDYIKRWRYPEELYQFISQALKCEGARAAVNLLRGPCAARRSQQFKRGVPTFVNVNTSRSNDPSIMTHKSVRTRDKQLYDVPAHGIADSSSNDNSGSGSETNPDGSSDDEMAEGDEAEEEDVEENEDDSSSRGTVPFAPFHELPGKFLWFIDKDIDTVRPAKGPA